MGPGLGVDANVRLGFLLGGEFRLLPDSPAAASEVGQCRDRLSALIRALDCV